MASGPEWSTSHMLANGSILSDIEEQGNRVEFCVHGKWTRMVNVPHVGERKYSFRYRGARKPRGIVSLLIGSQKIVSLSIYNYFLFLMNASVSTLTTKGAKHGTCWMSHTLAKGVRHEQRGRAQRKKTAW